MTRIVCSVALLLSCLTVFSQKEYFIYLQSENEQPFFIRLHDKTYASSSAGYVILPGLKDTSYYFTVGFPQNKWPDLPFSVAVQSKDRGFLLKHFGDKGWGLFDLQTLAVLMPAQAKDKEIIRTEPIAVSAFTEVLSKAANDPSLKERPVYAVAKTEEKNTALVKELAPQPLNPPITGQDSDKATQVIKTDTLLVKVDPPKQKPVTPLTVDAGKDTAYLNIKKEEPAAKEDLAKVDTASTQALAGNNSNLGQETKKEDPIPARTDSIKQEPVLVKKEDDPLAVEAGSQHVASVANTKKVAVEDNGLTSQQPSEYKRSVVTRRSESSTTEGFGLTFIDEYANGARDTIRIIIPNPPAPLITANEQDRQSKKFLDITAESEEAKRVVKTSALKPDCSSVATDNDFFRLRKKMAAQKEDESMLNEAKKEFRSRCFTVNQVLNLGNLFLSEAGKFQFYEAVHPYTSDKDNFSVLQGELKDPYFIHRFKNLIN